MYNKPPQERPTGRTQEIVRFRKAILKWYKQNGRDFPWRNTSDPFKLLIAEVMLRRTKADQVKSVYNRFTDRYPDADALNTATDEDIAVILRPLGLRWRVGPFCEMVREIGQKYRFKLPETRGDLKKLPGVGDYVAGAVLSIGFGKKEWIVDNNVVRLFKRYFGIKTSREGRRDKEIIEIAKLYVHTKDPRSANLAILDFTALVCTAKNPKHNECPIRDSCVTTMNPSLMRNTSQVSS